MFLANSTLDIQIHSANSQKSLAVRICLAKFLSFLFSYAIHNSFVKSLSSDIKLLILLVILLVSESLDSVIDNLLSIILLSSLLLLISSILLLISSCVFFCLFLLFSVILCFDIFYKIFRSLLHYNHYI